MDDSRPSGRPEYDYRAADQPVFIKCAPAMAVIAVVAIVAHYKQLAVRYGKRSKVVLGRIVDVWLGLRLAVYVHAPAMNFNDVSRQADYPLYEILLFAIRIGFRRFARRSEYDYLMPLRRADAVAELVYQNAVVLRKRGCHGLRRDIKCLRHEGPDHQE